MESSAQPHDIAEPFHSCQSFPAPRRTLTACPSPGRERMRRQPQPEEDLPRLSSRAAEAARQSKSLRFELANPRMPFKWLGHPELCQNGTLSAPGRVGKGVGSWKGGATAPRSEEHTSELQ